jgi:hypothetical protein
MGFMIRVIRSRRVTWVGHVARTRDEKYNILVEKSEGNITRKINLSADGRIILEWISEE